MSSLSSHGEPPSAGTFATPGATDRLIHASRVDNARVTIDISGDDSVKNDNECDDNAKCLELTERLITATCMYDNLKVASEGRIADLLFDRGDVSRRFKKALKKLDDLNMKVGEYCVSARLAGRERLRREEFYITQANFFEGTLAESELYVEQLKGEVAVLEEVNWALMHPAPKRARHGEYLGDEFLPLNFLTRG